MVDTNILEIEELGEVSLDGKVLERIRTSAEYEQRPVLISTARLAEQRGERRQYETMVLDGPDEVRGFTTRTTNPFHALANHIVILGYIRMGYIKKFPFHMLHRTREEGKENPN